MRAIRSSALSALDEAAAPFDRLGLRLTPAARHAGQGTANRACFVGNESTEFYVELLTAADPGEAKATAAEPPSKAATNSSSAATAGSPLEAASSVQVRVAGFWWEGPLPRSPARAASVERAGARSCMINPAGPAPRSD